jgi:5-methylcytosine-specific restriction endonuclease McrA
MVMRKWTDEQLVKAVRDCTSLYDVSLYLGLTPRGGSTDSLIRKKIKELEIDTGHFVRRSCRRRTIDDLFAKNTRYSSSTRRRYLELVPYLCVECGLSEWNGKTLTLQVDHINGDRTDNRLKNLRLLCPNCHSQTDNHSRPNWQNA